MDKITKIDNYKVVFTNLIKKDENVLTGRLISVINNIKYWTKDFQAELSNDESLMRFIVKSEVLTAEQKQLYLDQMSDNLKANKALIVELILDNAKCKANKIEKISFGRRVVNQEVLEGIKGNENGVFTTYSEGFDSSYFDNMVKEDADILTIIASKNKENPKFVRALMDAIVNSGEIYKLPAVIAHPDNFPYCEVLLRDTKYMKGIIAKIDKINDTKQKEVNSEFIGNVLNVAKSGDENTQKLCLEYAQIFNLYVGLVDDLLKLDKGTKEYNQKLACIKALEGKGNKNLGPAYEKGLLNPDFKELNPLYQEFMEKSDSIYEATLKFKEDLETQVNKAVKNKEEADKRLEEEKQAKKAKKEEKKKQPEEEKEPSIIEQIEATLGGNIDRFKSGKAYEAMTGEREGK